jgi:hypothetical protein
VDRRRAHTEDAATVAVDRSEGPGEEAVHAAAGSRWPRALLLLWVVVMTAVVVTGVVGFLVYFFLLVR